MNEGQPATDSIGPILEKAGINRAYAPHIGIGLAILALAALAAGAYYYAYYSAPVAPAELAAPAAETTEENISEASANPAEDIPETNPFEKAQNPFDSYTNPFE